MLEEKTPEWLEILRKYSLKSRLREKATLRRFNTWRIGGKAECLIDVVNVSELKYLVNLLVSYSVFICTLYGGSVLFYEN